MTRHATALLLLSLCSGLVLPPVLAEQKEGEDRQRPSTGTALEATYLVTLSLTESGETYDFSMTTATRHFTMNLGEKDIRLRGRVWPKSDDAKILEYTLEYTQWVDGAKAGKERRGSSWSGSLHLTEGAPVEIIRFLSGSFTIRMDPIDSPPRQPGG